MSVLRMVIGIVLVSSMLGISFAGDRLVTFSPEDFSLPKGTLVNLRVVEPVSSETAKIGDRVRFEVTEDVKIRDIVIIPKGSRAEGFVSGAMSARIWGSGRLELYVGSVRTRTGFNIPIHTTFNSDGRSISENNEAIISKGTSIVATTELTIPLEKTLYMESSPVSASNDTQGQ